MNQRNVSIVLVALVALFGVLVIASIGYNAGVEQGLVAGSRFVPVPAAPPLDDAPPNVYPQRPTYPQPYYAQPYYAQPPYYRPFGFLGGFFNLLFIGALLFFGFAFIRRLFWRRRGWPGPWGWHGRGHWGEGWPKDRPFGEWHRGSPDQDRTPPSGSDKTTDQPRKDEYI
jgi:hypothetical protein